MMTAQTHKWYAIKWRSLASFFLLISSVLILVSGLVLYIAPPGRYANFYGWSILWLDKGQWEAIHTLFSYTAVIFSIIHLVVNWQVLLNYLWDRARKAYALRRELTIAIVITILVGVGTIYNIPPFSTVMDLGESLSASWETGSISLTTTNRDEEHGVVTDVQPEQDVSDTTNVAQTDPADFSPGWGRYTLEHICAQENVPLTTAINRLADYGIEADASSRLRMLADANGYSPSEIVDIILGQPLGTIEGDMEH